MNPKNDKPAQEILNSDSKSPPQHPPQGSDRVHSLVQQFQHGSISLLDLGKMILAESLKSDDVLNIDLDRQRRCGFPEVVYGAGKSTDSIERAVEKLLTQHAEVLVTRVIPEQVRVLSERFAFHRWNHRAQTFRVGRETTPQSVDELLRMLGDKQLAGKQIPPRVAIVSAGTTDEPIALEAQETLAWMGHPSLLIQDVGVAGPYRLLARVPELQSMDVIVCVAGMEGALPSVLGGYVACPIIAIPTSVGYGANLGGISALLSMLNACAANVSVVNIDSGFKGGYMAGLIAERCTKR